MWIEYVALGVVQGLTEFLPVSSSGHLVLGEALLARVSPDAALPGGILFEVSVHVATLLAVGCVFRRRIVRLLTFPIRPPAPCGSGGAPAAGPFWRRAEAVWWGQIFAGSLVTGVIGLVFRERLESLFDRPPLVIVMLAVTGLILFGTRFAGRRGAPGRRLQNSPLWVGALIGLAQALAITPGISRSGATIAAALYLGVERDEAGEFSFLLSIPAILGAALVHLRDLDAIDAAQLGPLAAGFAAAFVVGVLALRLLLRFVHQGRLHHFAWYVWAVSAAGAAMMIATG
ncbi:MAG: undecaprenyl-diphosphatase UppP [Candidatus Sumerlaeia bacterium]